MIFPLLHYNMEWSWSWLAALQYGMVLILTCCVTIWNGLDPDLQNIDSYKEVKGKISPFIKIKSNSILSVHNVYGVKLLSRLKLNFSHLNKHKIGHGFRYWTAYPCAIVALPKKQYCTFTYNQDIKKLELLKRIP